VRGAIGLIIGLACYYVIGWALNTGLLDSILAAGLMVWLVGGFVGGAALLILGARGLI
jgi:hypothetical protein